MNKKTIVTIIVLILAILLVVLVWRSYNRNEPVVAANVIGQNVDYVNTYQDEDITIQEEQAKQGEVFLRINALAEAKMRLQELKMEITAGKDAEAAADEVAQVRSNLSQAYEGARDDIKNNWQEIDSELEILENQIREQSAEAEVTLERILDKMQALVDSQ